MRCGLVGGLAAIVLIAFVSVASAVAPQGPRLGHAQVTVEDLKKGDLLDIRHFNPFKFDLVTTGPLGGKRQVVTGASRGQKIVPLGGASWSPDGSVIAFSGGKVNLNGESSIKRDIYLVNANGSNLRRLTHVRDASRPVFSSDGQSIYFARLGPAYKGSGLPAFKSDTSKSFALLVPLTTSIWQVNVDGTGLRNLTPVDERTFDHPDSVSAASGELAFTRSACTATACFDSAMTLNPQTGVVTTLAADAFNPAFSPDGSQVMLDSDRDLNWPKHAFRKHRISPAAELYLLDRASGSLRRLTFTRGIDESHISWDPSGQRIAYARLGYSGEKIFEINPDGSCLTQVLRQRKNLEVFDLAPGWQPGPGREAGRIAC
jgi:Tol biopolymer transport system component